MPKAMILAAGLGTRLRPLTDDRPKALVAIDGMPLIDLQLLNLRRQGFTEVVVNVHHFADLLEGHLRSRDWGMELHISDERDLLRDTGGGLLHARPFLDGTEPFYLCNVDLLSDLDIPALMQAHARGGALATLSLRQRKSDRYLLWDDHLRLTGWENTKTGEVKGHRTPTARQLAFSGQQVISPEIFQHIARTGVFSIIDAYLDLAPSGRIHGQMDPSSMWLDVGKPAELEQGRELLKILLGNDHSH